MNRALIMLIGMTVALVMLAIILAGRIYQGRRAAAASGDGEVVRTVFPANRPLNVCGRSGSERGVACRDDVEQSTQSGAVTS